MEEAFGLCELWRDPSGFVRTKLSSLTADQYNELLRLYPGIGLPAWREIPVRYAIHQSIKV